MRIVKLSSLSEKERKKVLEEQEERYQQNKKESEERQKQGYQDFINKFGTGETQTSHTHTHQDMLNALDSKEQRDAYRKAHKLTLWDSIQDMMGNAGRVIDNLKNGAVKGIIGTGQTITRDAGDTQNIAYNTSKNITQGLFGKSSLSGTVFDPLSLVNKQQEKINEDRNKSLESMQNTRTKYNEKIQGNILKSQETQDPIGTKLTEIAPSIGQQIPAYVSNVIAPGSSLLYFKASSEADYYDDAKERGMSETESKIYSKLMSWVEAGTEEISLQNITKGGNAIKSIASGTKNAGIKTGLKAGLDVFKETAKEETANTFKDALLSYGVGISEEAFQEAITEPIQEFTAMKVAGEDKADWNNIWRRMLQSGLDGALSSAIIAGANMGISSCQGVVNKLENGQEFTTEEYNQAVKDASEKVDIQKLTADGIKNEVNKLKSERQEDTDKVINQETKTSQNQTSQEGNQVKEQIKNNLAKVKQFYDESTYNQMKEFIETAPSEEALNQINEDIKTETKNKLEEAYKSETFTESKERKKTYAKYQRQNNTTGIQYNNEVVDNALDTVAANRNGRRTVGQWKQVAEQIGLNVADLPKSQIDDIAYGSWFDLEPTKNITKYDNRTKEHKGFEKFTSDDWINTIYESAKGQKIQQLDTVLQQNKAKQNSEQFNKYSEEQSKRGIKPYTENDIQLYTKSNNNLIDGYNGNLKDFMNEYYDSTTKSSKQHNPRGKEKTMFLGRISDSISSKLNSLLKTSKNFNEEYDLKDNNFIVKENNIEHTFKEHGNETKPGQIDVTPENFSKIADVLGNPDYLGLSDNATDGNPTFYFAKKINGYSVAVEVAKKNKQLYPKSYFVFDSQAKEWNEFITNHKLKEADSMHSNELQNNSSEMNVQDDIVEASSINNSIPQNKQNVKSDNTTINSMQNTQENIQKKQTNQEEVNPYRNTGRANKLIKEKNERIRQLNNDLQNVTSKEAKSSIKTQIEKLEKQYNDKIQKLYNETNNIPETPKKLTRKEVRKSLLKEMNITPEDIQVGKDITSLNFQFTDPTRVNEKVFGRELGQKINEATINKTKHNTAEKIRWLNQERNDIQDLGIKARSKESSAVQKYGEKQYVDKNGDLRTYGDTELAKEFPNIETQEKIKHASEVIRQKYDTYIDQINEVLTSLGYDAIPKRQDYMRHFQELGDVFSQTGIPFNLNDMKAEDLPTDINGLTEFNKPGKNWFAQAQKRYGNKTTYDAITGIDGYLEGAGNLIFHTGDIQNYRALSELIRETYGQTKGFDNLDGLSKEQLQKRIEDIQSNKLSKYAAWLDEQANSLAGKKGAIDRGVERALGRRAYKVMNTLKSQVGSNMTGFNVRSALTNFISSTIGMAKTNKIAGARGLVSTVNNIFKNDGFINKSDFLTRRFGSDSLSQKTWQKVSNAGQIFMNGTDYFTANLITRSKYFEGLQKGMSEQQAIKFADDFAERVMGDRSQGATAEVFNSKTLGLLTQFQLEVNNQWQYMIHDTKMDFQKNAKTKGYLKAGATAVFQLGQLAGYSWLFNNMFEALTGSRAAFDPIEIIRTLFGIDDDDDDKEEKSFDKRMAEATEMLVDNIPLGNIVTGGGRIPISEAFQGISTLGKKLTNQKNKYGGDISWEDVGKDTLGALPYFVLPTGYGQIRKTVQGTTTVANSGDYTINKKGNKELKFPVENKNIGDYIKAGLFGKYSLPLAKEYIKNNFDRLSEKQTRMYEESKLPYKELLEYTKQGFKKQEEKIEYLSSKDMTEQQKWGIYKNDIFSNTERKDGGSQVKDAEYITSNGISKTEYINLYNTAHKNNIDMPTADEYKELKKNNIQLKNYIDYTVKAKKLLQEKKKNGELDENQQLKTSDKCKLLLDSNYSTAEKKGIYSQLVEKKDTVYSNLNKLTNLDINAYLDYKMQDIKGDEDKDSEIEGATESGTKKKNFIEYLNNSNLSGIARLYIYGKQYKYNSSEQNKMKEYIYNSSLSKDEKMEVIKELSKNVEKHKDGNYYWVKPAKK